jgi:restriction system protein
MIPLLSALRKLGGSASIDEMYEEVVEEQGFSEEALAVLQNPEKTNQTKIGYRLAWARTYLKKAGYLENSSRGVWALTEKARSIDSIDPKTVVSQVRQNDELSQPDSKDDCERVVDSEKPDEVLLWRERLHKLLIDEMSPDAFERLTQRMLRESGFIHVEVTGRTGDGGIDGKGIARINGLMSFHIAFQCKKYKGSVGAPEIRDFRGATAGRADRGLFITTGSFTKAAIEEANRDGVAPIDLIDGDQLADKLKELSLGVKTELVEKVSVVDDWFLSL